jgi:hypothetical protein
MKEVDRWGLEKVSGLPFWEAWVAEGRCRRVESFRSLRGLSWKS